MKLLIIRHADPDYSIDSLTEKGWREAELLSKRLEKQLADSKERVHIYCSPLGRAKDTASLTLKKLDLTAEERPWLREFAAQATDEETGQKRICWDLIPQKWTAQELNYDKDRWAEVPFQRNANSGEEAQWVWNGLDEVLKTHGYERKGNCYQVNQSNRDIVVLFCHFGVECVMLSHLLGISPVVLWHGFCAAPSSVTTLITEERREGTALFRMGSFGDTSHLYVENEPIAFAARFCETYDNMEERHD
ncbi:MAG: histidine phosphatase family protein [Lachnospiraceae bacterium]|nr:histidine phosphatase family protein [Lachnospiraceae bacterium]